MTQQRSGAKGRRLYTDDWPANKADCMLVSQVKDHITPNPVSVFSLSPSAHEARVELVAAAIYEMSPQVSVCPFDVAAIPMKNRFRKRAEHVLSQLNLAPKGARKQAR